MMYWKFLIAASGMVALAAGMAGCATTGNDASSMTAVPADQLRCVLPTNCVSSLGDNGMPALAFTGSGAEGLARLRATVQSFPEATVQLITDTKLVAVFTTAAGFRDTVDFGIDSTAHRIDFRSRSDFGLYDFGKNRSRMTEFATRFAQQVVR